MEATMKDADFERAMRDISLGLILLRGHMLNANQRDRLSNLIENLRVYTLAEHEGGSDE